MLSEEFMVKHAAWRRVQQLPEVNFRQRACCMVWVGHDRMAAKSGSGSGGVLHTNFHVGGLDCLVAHGAAPQRCAQPARIFASGQAPLARLGGVTPTCGRVVPSVWQSAGPFSESRCFGVFSFIAEDAVLEFQRCGATPPGNKGADFPTGPKSRRCGVPSINEVTGFPEFLCRGALLSICNCEGSGHRHASCHYCRRRV